MLNGEMLRSRVGIVIISIIWGLGIATLFRKACDGKTCTIIKYTSPNVKDIENSYYNYGTNECFQYSPVISKCN